MNDQVSCFAHDVDLSALTHAGQLVSTHRDE